MSACVQPERRRLRGLPRASGVGALPVAGHVLALLALLALLACCLFACGQGESTDAERAATARGRVSGPVVSTVNGDPISLDEVQQLVRASSLAPAQALHRLEAERLLMAEAARRGVKGPEVDLVASRARVQALLQAEADAVQVSDEELRSAYATDARFHMPERRKSLHVLARLSKTATLEEDRVAKELAAAALEDLGTTAPEAIVARYRKLRVRGIELKAEALPPAGRSSGLVSEFKDALFSIAEAGVVPQPVRTSFGWHAIRVLEIMPALEVPFEEAVVTLREEILLRRRKERVESLLTDLRRDRLPQLDKDVAAKLAWIEGP